MRLRLTKYEREKKTGPQMKFLKLKVELPFQQAFCTAGIVSPP